MPKRRRSGSYVTKAELNRLMPPRQVRLFGGDQIVGSTQTNTTVLLAPAGILGTDELGVEHSGRYPFLKSLFLKIGMTVIANAGNLFIRYMAGIIFADADVQGSIGHDFDLGSDQDRRQRFAWGPLGTYLIGGSDEGGTHSLKHVTFKGPCNPRWAAYRGTESMLLVQQITGHAGATLNVGDVLNFTYDGTLYCSI